MTSTARPGTIVMPATLGYTMAGTVLTVHAPDGPIEVEVGDGYAMEGIGGGRIRITPGGGAGPSSSGPGMPPPSGASMKPLDAGSATASPPRPDEGAGRAQEATKAAEAAQGALDGLPAGIVVAGPVPQAGPGRTAAPADGGRPGAPVMHAATDTGVRPAIRHPSPGGEPDWKPSLGDNRLIFALEEQESTRRLVGIAAGKYGASSWRRVAEGDRRDFMEDMKRIGRVMLRQLPADISRRRDLDVGMDLLGRLGVAGCAQLTDAVLRDVTGHEALGGLPPEALHKAMVALHIAYALAALFPPSQGYQGGRAALDAWRAGFGRPAEGGR